MFQTCPERTTRLDIDHLKKFYNVQQLDLNYLKKIHNK